MLCFLSAAKATDWSFRPLVDPTLNLHTFDASGNRYYGVNVGGDLGVSYAQNKSGLRLNGLTRARYIKTIGPNVDGEEIRLGSFMGPWFAVAGLQVGPDVVFSKYENPAVSMDPVVGLAVPASALIDLKILRLTGQAGPTFYVHGDREGVNWSQTSFPGFGDEFTYGAGATIDLFLISFSLSYVRRITGFGDEDVVGFGVSFL